MPAQGINPISNTTATRLQFRYTKRYLAVELQSTGVHLFRIASGQTEHRILPQRQTVRRRSKIKQDHERTRVPKIYKPCFDNSSIKWRSWKFIQRN